VLTASDVGTLVLDMGVASVRDAEDAESPEGAINCRSTSR
jgi:hypothetical protein